MCMHVRVNVCECVPSQQIWRSAEGVLYTPPDDGSQSDFVPTVTTSKNVVRNLSCLYCLSILHLMHAYSARIVWASVAVVWTRMRSIWSNCRSS